MSTIGKVSGFFLEEQSWISMALLFYVTLIGIPIGRACIEFARFSVFPFGKEVVRETDVKGWEHVALWR